MSQDDYEPIADAELPHAVATYLAAHRAKDAGTASEQFTEAAVVVDDGHTHTGRAEIDAWLGRSSSEYTYTTTLLRSGRLDAAHYRAVQRLEGNFPGGVVDLCYSFALQDGTISELVIEPEV